ncbi:CHAT domain-containing protein [Mastigocoleus sp. MO_188.B34]|uniref:CHAT domain-containing protein n=1 Tax=Mastigocoleus sp. MO_188.B34 TaxID=3036635 RepID=UPI00261BF682|nr:CHAT domain-containing protein [Mastigocoleus sp. MO_188.B34]
MFKGCSNNMRRFLAVLFIFSLICSIWLSDILLPFSYSKFSQIVAAQRPQATQQVEKGINYYQIGNYQAAIQEWNKALEAYQKTGNSANIAIINENIARGYGALGEGEKALEKWEELVVYYGNSGERKLLGRALTEQAQVYSSLGQPLKAIEILYGLDRVGTENIELKKTEGRKNTALQIAREEKDKKGEAAALGSLGDAYRKRGNYDRAIECLQQALSIDEASYEQPLLNSLGNTYTGRAQRWNLRSVSAKELDMKSRSGEFEQNARIDYQQAKNNFQKSFELARQKGDRFAKMRSLLSLIQLSYTSREFRIFDRSEVDRKIQEALVLLKDLPNTRNKVYAAVDLTNLPAVDSQEITSPLTQCVSPRRITDMRAKDLLEGALKNAEEMNDNRSKSFALGALGHFYECNNQYENALSYTRQALLAADQKLKARDSVYLWEWQIGRIFRKQGKSPQEIADAYQRAYLTLEEIRSDILKADKDLQFDFRDVIEPVYRDLAELRLELALQNDSKLQVSQAINLQTKQVNFNKTSKNSSKTQENLDSAIQTIDSLRLAELQNFFGNDCILAAISKQAVNELVGEETAVLSSIVVDKGVAILLRLPGDRQKVEWVEDNGKIIGSQIIENEIKEFRDGLKKGQKLIQYDTSEAAKLYQWFIAPFKNDLENNNIKTLVLIQDGILRTIPMAALFDSQNEKYLIEEYALATTPSLKLTAPKKLKTQKNSVLILALTEESRIGGKIYSALFNVEEEVSEVKKLFPQYKDFIDREFQPSNVEIELEQNIYPIIHIATHAQFGTIPEDTFLIAGRKNDNDPDNEKLTINELEIALRKVKGGSHAIELLTLSACETAFGDDRSALGLAGVALQSGVRSAVASLWTIADASTSILVSEFYNNLKSGKSKAEALQAAQIKLIKAKEDPEANRRYDNPYYWASFILIGNWL